VKTLNVVGCGKVGKTLGRLWTQHAVFRVTSILNRSLESASKAVEFVGSGRAVGTYAELGEADVVMISTPDESIEGCCRELCDSGVLAPGVVVFHCSGSLPSQLLDPARGQGASIAGIHPVKSFAEVATSVETFAGTFCALEGDPAACEVLDDALRRCGATTFHVEAEFKTIYHTATVIACNYLVALMEVGLRCFEKAGLDRRTAMEVAKPIVAETVDNVFKLGPVDALTGPIARGEPSVVQRQLEALGEWDEDVRRVYESLGRIAVELSAARGNADPDVLAAIKTLLRS